MASYKKDNRFHALFVFFSWLLCTAAIVLSVFLSQDGASYAMDKVEKVSLSSQNELLALGKGSYNDQIELKGDVTLVFNETTAPVFSTAENPFSGTLDGNGHTLTVVYKSLKEGDSLFGTIAPDGVIKNVNFVVCGDKDMQTGAVIADRSDFGGIARVNEGKIENCKLTFPNMTLSSTGVFSPFVTVNKGKISCVYVKGSLINGSVKEKDEGNVHFGAVCAYNQGSVESAISAVEFFDFQTMQGTAPSNQTIAVTTSANVNGVTKNVVECYDKDTTIANRSANAVNFSATEQIFTVETMIKLRFLTSGASLWTLQENENFKNAGWQTPASMELSLNVVTTEGGAE